MRQRDDQRASTCHGKVAFQRFSMARAAARRSRRNHEENLQPYKCAMCAQFHIGLSTEKEAGVKYRQRKRELKEGEGE